MTAPGGSNDFVVQWAIRMPDGRLFALHLPSSHAVFIFGAIPAEPEPTFFSSRAEAEYTLESLRQQASRILGVTHWGGWIEQRICSPLTAADPGEQFADEVTRWAQRQGGES